MMSEAEVEHHLHMRRKTKSRVVSGYIINLQIQSSVETCTISVAKHHCSGLRLFQLVRGCGSKDSMDEGEGVLLVAWKTSLYIFGGGCFARRVTERSGEMGLRGARRRGLNGVSRDLHRSSSLRNASAPRVVERRGSRVCGNTRAH